LVLSCGFSWIIRRTGIRIVVKMGYTQRMIVATIIVIVSVVTFIIGYICLAWPLMYVTDALIDGWPTGANITQVVGSVEEIRNSETNLNYFLAAAFLIGIVLTFVWYWAYAHKRENEQD
jgi:fucose 4-O-acetylase-like acetyltransferase